MTDWQAHAACVDTTIDFFSETPSKIRQAKRLCESCPVVADCLQWAKDEGFEYGVFGGMTADERRGSRRVPRPRGYAAGEIDHGTNAGYKAHQRRRETACEDCKDAHARYQFDRKRQQREYAARKRAEERNAAEDHGTDAGYQRHLAEQSTPCDACREARRRTQAAYRARKRRAA